MFLIQLVEDSSRHRVVAQVAKQRLAARTAMRAVWLTLALVTVSSGSVAAAQERTTVDCARAFAPFFTAREPFPTAWVRGSHVRIAAYEPRGGFWFGEEHPPSASLTFTVQAGGRIADVLAELARRGASFVMLHTEPSTMTGAFREIDVSAGPGEVPASGELTIHRNGRVVVRVAGREPDRARQLRCATRSTGLVMIELDSLGYRSDIWRFELAPSGPVLE